jgi:hypothetical protein
VSPCIEGVSIYLTSTTDLDVGSSWLFPAMFSLGVGSLFHLGMCECFMNSYSKARYTLCIYQDKLSEAVI